MELHFILLGNQFNQPSSIDISLGAERQIKIIKADFLSKLKNQPLLFLLG
jgi:hypothetical protein